MMPGLPSQDQDKTTEEVSSKKEKKDDTDREEEEEDGVPLPTPRKRRLNFKIPLLGGQSRDARERQSAMAISRRLFKDHKEVKGQAFVRVFF